MTYFLASLLLGNPASEHCLHSRVSLQAVEKVLFPHLPAYWANLQAVLDDYSVSNAQVKADGHKVYGAILVSWLFLSLILMFSTNDEKYLNIVNQLINNSMIGKW